jgi:hypothetical protein
MSKQPIKKRLAHAAQHGKIGFRRIEVRVVNTGGKRLTCRNHDSHGVSDVSDEVQAVSERVN